MSETEKNFWTMNTVQFVFGVLGVIALIVHLSTMSETALGLAYFNIWCGVAILVLKYALYGRRKWDDA